MTAVPVSAPAAPPHPLSALVDGLVRDGAGFRDAVRASPPRELVRALLVVATLGAALFGAVVGSSRGGVQIAYAAVKVPLLALGTLALSMPAFLAIARAAELSLTREAVVSLSLGAAARFSLVLAGLSPVVWLAEGAFGYHGLVLCVTACCGVAGLAGASLLFRGLSGAGRWGRAGGVGFALVFAVLGVHVAWMLRPFVLQPGAGPVPFVRPVEGDIFTAVAKSVGSVASTQGGRRGLP